MACNSNYSRYKQTTNALPQIWNKTEQEFRQHKPPEIPKVRLAYSEAWVSPPPFVTSVAVFISTSTHGLQQVEDFAEVAYDNWNRLKGILIRSVGFIAPKRLAWFPIFRFWEYPMKVIERTWWRLLSVPDEGYYERTWWRLLSVPDEGYWAYLMKVIERTW
jgi:hypothetical protein